MTIKPTLLSCVVLTCDSHIQKGNSVLHCLRSLMMQDFPNFELILVENSHDKTRGVKEIERKLEQWNRKRITPIAWKIINNRKPVSYGRARNLGSERAQGDILVFLDDDTIVVEKNALAQIGKLAENFDFGCGARRLWTRGNSFQKNSVGILEAMKEGGNGVEMLLRNTNKPSIRARGITNSHLLSRTFIANYGFCRKQVFNEVLGFADFPGYGFEDDHLLFKLYQKGYSFTKLDSTRVVHVNHQRNKDHAWNFPYYFAELVKHGYYSFDVHALLKGKIERSEILKPLGVLHYDDRIEASFEKYKKSIPLDLSRLSEETPVWQNLYRLEKPVFARLVHNIQHCSSLDAMVQKSQADFDNLGPLIQLAIQDGFIDAKNSDSIQPSWRFRFTHVDRNKRAPKTIKPKSELNQFPCDEGSRKRRYKFLKERFPFAEYLSIGFIGDDDLVSTEFINDYWAWPVVVEKDEAIINLIQTTSPRVKIIQEDIRKFSAYDNLPKVHAFFTDPPYTLNGSLAFIYAGLKLLKLDGEIRELYAILNKTMLGKQLFRIQEILAQANIFLTETIANFSQYKLPEYFDENQRARNFLKTININENSLKYSSSSNLYIFETIQPDLKFLRKQINFNELYNHYL